MSWCWFKPASAVPTIWACFPRHGGPPRRAPAAGRKACPQRSRRLAHVCSLNELPNSSLQLRFREFGGTAVPPSRHAGRCCDIPGSRRNHRELHPSPEIGLPTPVSGVRWTPPESRDRTSDLQPQTSITSKSFRMHCYEKRACKCFGMHCYKIIGLKVPWNEYLQKKAGGGSASFGKSGQHRLTSLNLANARKRFRYNGRVQGVATGESG